MIQSISNIVVAVAAVATIVMAVIGLSTWRRALHGRATFETAQRFLKAVYTLRDEIGYIRAPFIHGSEFPPDFDLVRDEQTAQKKAAGYAHVYSNRMRRLRDILAEFDTTAVEAEVVLGGEFKERARNMRLCVSRLNATVQAFIDNIRDDVAKSDRDFVIKIRKEINAGDGANSDDELSQKMHKAFTAIEEAIRPYLKR